MRITGGKFKGMEIVSKSKKDEHIRPTSGKIREAIFNLLLHGKFLKEVSFIDEENPSLLDGRVVADLYSGTGILGFEALSRGAKTVIFADNNNESLKISQANAKKFKSEDDCVFIRCNAAQLPNPYAVADVIFMDPPYEQNLVKPCLKSIEKMGWLRDGGIVIVEHSKFEEISEIKHFKTLDFRPYNNTVLTVLEFSADN